MKILVTDGDSRAALAIVRSLGAKGHRIFVGNSSNSSLAASSRFCDNALKYPDPAKSQRDFLDSLVSLIKIHQIDVLIPVTDICVLAVSANRSEFPQSCIIPLASTDALIHAANKVQIMKTAERLGVATPKSVLISSLHDYQLKRSTISFPVVVKPSRSRIKVDGGWISTSVDYASNEETLLNKLQSLHPAAFPILVQERIHGPGLGLFYCFDKGEPVAVFAHQRLREKPPSGGVSVLRESVAPHRLADEFGRALLRDLSWCGVAMVEFKLDERDGIPKLMEINGRFWGSLQLAIDSGVDFPEILLSVFLNKPAKPIESYKLGVRSRWLWGEIDLLLMYLLKSKNSLKLPDHSESPYISALKIMNPWVRGQKLEVFRLNDIRPWIYETLGRFKTLVSGKTAN